MLICWQRAEPRVWEKMMNIKTIDSGGVPPHSPVLAFHVGVDVVIVNTDQTFSVWPVCHFSVRSDDVLTKIPSELKLSETAAIGGFRWFQVHHKTSAEVERLMVAAQTIEDEDQRHEEPTCPHCGTTGRSGPSTLGGPGCQWYCYKCCETY